MTAARLAMLAAACVALSACANDRVWMRSGASSSDADIDEVSCAEEAEKSGVSVSIGGDASPPMDRFSQRYACLRARGYKLVTLDGDEAARLKSLSGAAREDYWRDLLVKRGFAPSQPPRAPALIGDPPRGGPAPAQ